MKTLHVYGQGAWHDDVWIVGDRAALVELDLAIQGAMNGSLVTGCANVFTNDGEGYRLRVLCVPAKVAGTLAVPYTDEIASEREEGRTRKWPWELGGVIAEAVTE